MWCLYSRLWERMQLCPTGLLPLSSSFKMHFWNWDFLKILRSAEKRQWAETEEKCFLFLGHQFSKHKTTSIIHATCDAAVCLDSWQSPSLPSHRSRNTTSFEQLLKALEMTLGWVMARIHDTVIIYYETVCALKCVGFSGLKWCDCKLQQTEQPSHLPLQWCLKTQPT